MIANNSLKYGKQFISVLECMIQVNNYILYLNYLGICIGS